MTLGTRFEEALVWAARLHAGQTRKASDVPYVAHLLAVAGLVLDHGGDEDDAIAALLHDAIEDQGGARTREEIERRFGGWVVAIVDGCTDAETIPKPPWRARKEAHLERVRQATSAVKRVVAADKLHNARALAADWRRLGEGVWERFRGGREGTLWYYQEMLAAVREGAPAGLVGELESAVAELLRLASTTTGDACERNSASPAS